MWVRKINTMQSGDCDHLTDDIFFSGCSIKCDFCFNKELWEQKEKDYIHVVDIISQLSDIEWVALLGGEPVEQGYPKIEFIVDELHKIHKKVIIFTWIPIVMILLPKIDYYHIDIKESLNIQYDTTEIDTKQLQKISYGFVITKQLNKEKIKYMFDNINRKVPIYLKNTSGNDPIEYRKFLLELGFEKVYINEKIKL